MPRFSYRMQLPQIILKNEVSVIGNSLVDGFSFLKAINEFESNLSTIPIIN